MEKKQNENNSSTNYSLGSSSSKKKIIQIVLILIVLIIVFTFCLIISSNKKKLISLIQNDPNSNLVSFCKLIINNLKYLWLPQVGQLIKQMTYMRISSEIIISFLIQFYGQTDNSYKLCQYILNGYYDYEQQIINQQNSEQMETE